MSGLHFEAAKILEKTLHRNKGDMTTSLRSLMYSNKRITNVKGLYKLVCETLKYKDVLEEVIEMSNIMALERGLPLYLVYVLIYELLLGQGLKGKTSYEKLILRNKSNLHACLERLKIRRKVKSIEELLPEPIRDPVNLPRYVRVNTLKCTVDDMVKYFQSQQWNFVKKPETYRSLIHKTFCRDQDLDFLLVFPPKYDFHDDSRYLRGDIILQDKASCIPPIVLSPLRGSLVIDACAAPGNKTSLLSAIMGNTGSIFAFDMDSKRLDLLKRLTSKAGVTRIRHLDVIAELKNFLNVPFDSKPYSEVEYILLDPSCSGSGMVRLLDNLVNRDSEESLHTENLETLAAYQINLLSHALQFPKVKRVVYSTCSVNEIENEDVVKKVLKDHPEFKLIRALENWPRRGISSDEFPEGKECVRMDSALDETIGFFVACFERLAPS